MSIKSSQLAESMVFCPSQRTVWFLPIQKYVFLNIAQKLLELLAYNLFTFPKYEFYILVMKSLRLRNFPIWLHHTVITSILKSNIHFRKFFHERRFRAALNIEMCFKLYCTVLYCTLCLNCTILKKGILYSIHTLNTCNLNTLKNTSNDTSKYILNAYRSAWRVNSSNAWSQWSYGRLCSLKGTVANFDSVW